MTGSRSGCSGIHRLALRLRNLGGCKRWSSADLERDSLQIHAEREVVAFRYPKWRQSPFQTGGEARMGVDVLRGCKTVAVLAVLGVPTLAGAEPRERSAEPSDPMVELLKRDHIQIERGITWRGDALHTASTGRHLGTRVSDRLAFTFSSSEAGFGLRHETMSAGIAARAGRKTFTIPDDPNPPMHPGRPGNSESTTIGCASISQGGGSGFADITYNYEYRYTEDTDGDHEPDANADWVLIGVRVDYLNFQDAQFCQ
ncbi:MAG: hypothetical protein OMOMHJEC_00002 [Xanthomonadales bacterium]|nr:hypothetical protein [Xanthomonadales bacterium]